MRAIALLVERSTRTVVSAERPDFMTFLRFRCRIDLSIAYEIVYDFVYGPVVDRHHQQGDLGEEYTFTLLGYDYAKTGRRRMAMSIKDREAERLAAEIAAITGESKTRAVRVSLQERRDRLSLHLAGGDRRVDLLRFLREEIWPSIPSRLRGKGTTRREREKILGYGPKGV
jgi:antitoxin VapB